MRFLIWLNNLHIKYLLISSDMGGMTRFEWKWLREALDQRERYVK